MEETVERVTVEEKELLLLRTGHIVTEICSKHRKSYQQHYSMGQKKCCDPLRNHPTKTVTRSLCVITCVMAEKWSTEGLTLVPGKKLCTCCRKQLSKQDRDMNIGAVDGNVDKDSEGDSVDDDESVYHQLSTLLVGIGESLLDKKRMHVKRYADKMKRIEESLRNKLGLGPSKVEEDFKEMIVQLKHKFEESEKVSDKIQVLTVLAVRKIQEEFW